MSSLTIMTKELDNIVDKYADKPEIQKDFQRVISLLADLIGETMVLAMIEVRKKERLNELSSNNRL